MRRIIKEASTLGGFLLALFLTSSQNYAYAVDCTLSDPPTPAQFICPFVRVFNLLLILAGAVLLIFIVVGAIKMATAMGDPKGLKSSYDTWVYAVVGAFIVLGVFAIFRIINNLFGLSLGQYFGLDGVNLLFSRIGDVMQNLFENILHISGDPNYN